MKKNSFTAKSNTRIDLSIKSEYPDLSRNFITSLIKQKLVNINNVTILKSSSLVKPNDIIEFCLPKPQTQNITPLDSPLDIIYEDNDILVINKPPFLPVHPSHGHQHDTLINILIHHYPEFKNFEAINGIYRPGIIHRLDKDTSGILVIAKNQKSMKTLQTDIKDKIWTKKYQAIVLNDSQKGRGVITKNIVRSSSDRQKFGISNLNKGKTAITNYSVLENYDYNKHHFSLVDIHIETGRTHQIRVHLLSENMPILGDTVYHTKDSQKISKSLNIDRQLLHAYSLEIIHPITKTKLKFTSQIPPDFEKIISIFPK
jgi:23S rRNA pseudouridine1911/1915/1917 synthase